MSNPKTISEMLFSVEKYLEHTRHPFNNQLLCLQFGYLLRNLELSVDHSETAKDAVSRLISAINALYGARTINDTPKEVIANFSDSISAQLTQLRQMVIVEKLT